MKNTQEPEESETLNAYLLDDTRQSLGVAIEHLKLCAEVVEKAKALIARWEQPSWKDVEPTAGFINALRNAVRNYEENVNDW